MHTSFWTYFEICRLFLEFSSLQLPVPAGDCDVETEKKSQLMDEMNHQTDESPSLSWQAAQYAGLVSWWKSWKKDGCF
jgi:hypothetical protein